MAHTYPAIDNTCSAWECSKVHLGLRSSTSSIGGDCKWSEGEWSEWGWTSRTAGHIDGDESHKVLPASTKKQKIRPEKRCISWKSVERFEGLRQLRSDGYSAYALAARSSIGDKPVFESQRGSHRFLCQVLSRRSGGGVRFNFDRDSLVW